MPERALRRLIAVCLALAAAGSLAACGADDESPTSARTATALTTTATATTPSTPAGTSTAAATEATAVTPGVGDRNATTVARDDAISCAGALGRRVDDVDIDVTALAQATTTTTTTPDASSRASATDADALARPFSASSPWNTAIDTSAVDRRSRTWIERASRRIAVVAARNDAGVDITERRARDLRLYVNTCAWTPAIVGEDDNDGEEVRIVCRQRNCGPVAREVRSLRIPRGLDPLPEFDGWYSVIDESAGVGYDMWRARRAGNLISYQFIKRWLLDGPGFSAPATRDPIGAVGARGSGLPLFAGVIHANELRRGRIEHALAISVPGPAQRNFVPPASVTNGLNALQSIPEGARLRLRSDFQRRRLPRGTNRRSADAIVTALRTYGAIVVDRAITPTLYAARTDFGTLLQGNELQGLRLSDLEVVDTGRLLTYPPLDQTFEAVEE